MFAVSAISRSGRRRGLAVLIGGCILLGGGACEPVGSGADSRATVHSCSPGYTDENEFGRLSVQQRGPGAPVLWGVHPKQSAARYVFRIYAGARKRDGKSQAYPPHGSLPAVKYRSGNVFRLEGETYNLKGELVGRFFIRCRLV